MNVLENGIEDPLAPIGVIAGTFLVCAAIGTIAGAPWNTQDIMSASIRVVGSVLMIGLGAGLAYLGYKR
jgi:hypothetical protein